MAVYEEAHTGKSRPGLFPDAPSERAALAMAVADRLPDDRQKPKPPPMLNFSFAAVEEGTDNHTLLIAREERLGIP